MAKKHSFTGYLLIGIGLFFLLKQLKIPIFTDFYSWPTLLIIIGAIFIIHSYRSKEYDNLFTGTIILGLGIHFHGVNHYNFWIDNWAVYPFIIGVAFLVRAFKTKKGMLIGLLLTFGSIIMISSIQLPTTFNWIYTIRTFLESYWPIILIVTGLYFLFSKK